MTIRVLGMEVTNISTNQFAPKLGQTTSDTFSSDAFSTHLAETDAYAPDDADTRVSDRNAEADDRRAEERQADADKAADAEDDRRADEQDRNENARSDDESESADQDEATSSGSGLSVGTAEADTTDLSVSEEQLYAETAAVTDAEENSASNTKDSNAEGNIFTDTDATTATTDASVTANEATPLTNADTQADKASETQTVAAESDTLTADELALQTAQSSNTSATANADATAGSSAQQAVRPAQNATAQTAQQAAQAATSADDQSSGLTNPLETGLQSDTDTDGERGLGHQAAEAMAGKSKSTTTNTQTPSAPQAAQTAVPTAAPAAAPVTPLQAMAAAGLNLSSLPSDLNLDLLNLNAPNQTSPAGTPQNSNPVLVRFGALPGQAQATQVPNTAIALQISKHIARGVSTFEIRLDPAEMGRIDVKLELAQDGRVTAHLAVEKAETLDLLQKDAKALEQALKDAGLDADSDTLNFSLKNGNENADGSEGETRAAGEDHLNTDDDGEDVLLNAIAARQIEAAARGGVDVSI